MRRIRYRSYEEALYNGLSDKRSGLSVREPFLKFNFINEIIIRASQVTRQLKSFFRPHMTIYPKRNEKPLLRITAPDWKMFA